MSEGFFFRLIKKVELVEKWKIAKNINLPKDIQRLPADEPEDLSGEIIFDSSAMADPFEVQAVIAQINGNHAEELRLYESLLSSSDPAVKARSQYNLASLYQHGRGVKVDFGRAFELFEQAAAAGYSLAQTSLANFYVHGLAGPTDIKQALHWYLKAAIKGDPGAMKGLGVLYYSAKNYNKAAEWYKLAADEGDEKSCYDFAYLHLARLISPQDIDQARKYLIFGTEMGDVKCAIALGSMHSTGDRVDLDHYEAIKYYGIAAKLGDAEGMFEFGSLCRDDRVKKNLPLAVEFITKSAENGYSKAQATIGKMCLDGVEIVQNFEMAMRWLNKAAIQHDENALYYLGYTAEYGNGSPVDFIEAHKWYNLASARGVAVARERRDELAIRMSPTDVMTAQNRAREWTQENVVMVTGAKAPK